MGLATYRVFGMPGEWRVDHDGKAIKSRSRLLALMAKMRQQARAKYNRRQVGQRSFA